jgi:CDP-glucose 4,6-dehydratase
MSFWQGKKVLITGASGFVGLHLIKKLAEEGAAIITFSKSKIPNLGKGIIAELGSVTNFSKLNSVIKKNRIAFIFHLAAQPLVEVGQVNPLSTFEVNIKGTWNLLEAAKEANVQKIIVASTAHVYGDNPDVPYKEEYYPQPSRPYETSKACADLLSQVYADTYGLPIEIPRFVNIYGPGDSNVSRLIPKIISSILEGKNPKIWDAGTVRDFLYIDDAVDAYLALAEKDLPKTKRGRVINFGTGRPINIVELAKKIIEISEIPTVKLVKEPPPEDRSSEIKEQYVSIAKANRELNWFPKIDLDEGLKRTYIWYKENSLLF